MSDLTDRMRTCAAFIASLEHGTSDRLLVDAVDLLIEASNVLEAIPPPLGEPMAIIPPVEVKPSAPPEVPRTSVVPRAVWTTGLDTLPPPVAGNGPPRPRAPRVCPNCDSRAAKRVQREGSKLMLVCPVCAHTWPYRA